MPGQFYDRQGVEITADQWRELYESQEYYRIASDFLDNGLWVSTVWLGVDHDGPEGKPLIFETAVFPHKDGGKSIHSQLYCTEKEAVLGHARTVQRWKHKKTSIWAKVLDLAGFNDSMTH